jgi:hypothetical protein
MKIGFVLFQGIPLREKEIALVTQKPISGHCVCMLLIGMPVKVSSPFKGLQTKGTRDSHTSKRCLSVGGGGVRLQDSHAREVHLTGGAHQPAVDNVL